MVSKLGLPHKWCSIVKLVAYSDLKLMDQTSFELQTFNSVLFGTNENIIILIYDNDFHGLHYIQFNYILCTCDSSLFTISTVLTVNTPINLDTNVLLSGCGNRNTIHKQSYNWCTMFINLSIIVVNG